MKSRSKQSSVEAEKDLRKTIGSLLSAQRFAVLATYSDGQPYASLMAFAATDDLRHIVLVTNRNTHKYENLRAHPRTALLIDSRANQDSDVATALSITVFGEARELEGAQREHLLKLYLGRHPGLKEFATAPSAAVLAISVERYYVVRSLSDVTELRIGS